MLDPTEAALEQPVSTVVLILGGGVLSASAEYAAAYPQASIHVLCPVRAVPAAGETVPPHVEVHPAGSVEERRSVLRDLDRPQILVEDGTRWSGAKAAHLRHLLWFVEPGGVYVVESADVPANPSSSGRGAREMAELFRTLDAARTARKRALDAFTTWEVEVARSSEPLEVGEADQVVLRKRFRHAYKLREWEAEPALTRHFGADAGVFEVLERRPAEQFTSRSRRHTYGDGPSLGADLYEVPERTVRRYRDAVCYSRQVVGREGYWLPDSFRHPLHPRLTSRNLVAGDPSLARVTDTDAVANRRTVSGDFFYLDTEFPGHFGHVTTEVLSRTWGWEVARRAFSAIRPLVSLRSGTEAMPGFQRQIFAALGIDPESVEYVRAGESVEVESLVAATPQFVNPQYVDPAVAETWQALGAGISDDGVDPTPDRFFVSRRGDKRACFETRKVESFFAKQGFAIVYPEDLPYARQVRMFQNAHTIAGFGGSGMFNMMFAPQARIVLVSSNNYDAENEALFAAVNGNDIHYFWGEAELPSSGEGFNREEFQSSWHFDVRAHKRDLRAALA